MCRLLLVSLIAVGLLAGCAQQQPKMEDMTKPAPAPELMRLQCWVGTWSGTAEMVSPSPEEMQKMMPPGSKEVPKSMNGSEKAEWVLGGMFLKSEGWHDMGEGQRENYVHYVAWDATAKKYHSWFLSDWGNTGEGWMTMDADGKTCRITEKGMNAKGLASTGEGMMTFVDDKTIDWTWTENTPQGKMKLKGTSKKQP